MQTLMKKLFLRKSVQFKRTFKLDNLPPKIISQSYALFSYKIILWKK
jgi:hypothetical protein